MRVKGCCGGVPRCVRIVLHCGIDCTESKPETTEHYALVRWLWYCNNSHDSTIFTTHKAASIAPLVIVSSIRLGLVKDPFVCSRVIFHFVPKCFQITHTVDLRRAASCLKAKWIMKTGKLGNTCVWTHTRYIHQDLLVVIVTAMILHYCIFPQWQMQTGTEDAFNLLCKTRLYDSLVAQCGE
jgi:hypothetical protein